MLEAYMDLSGKSNKIKSTLQQHQRSIDSLTEEFRAPFFGPITSLDAPCPKATHGPSSDPLENTDFSNMVPLVPLHMSYATVLTNQKNGPLVYPGQLQQSFITNDKKRELDRDRAPQLCSTCGHYRQHNSIHNQKHVIKCAVREDLYSIDRSVKGWCSCSECMEGAKNVGYTKPALVVKQMRSLKTCKNVATTKTMDISVTFIRIRNVMCLKKNMLHKSIRDIVHVKIVYQQHY
jgi:hypothetical protein